VNALALALALSAACPAAQLRGERLVLSTEAGDLVIAPYAGAPRHAAKLKALFTSGAYETAPVFKIDPTRLVHVGGVDRRARPLAEKDLVRIARLPLEPGAGPHRAGTVTMAHDPSDPDPRETSFVILLADIPVMDGRFTAVGEIVGGSEVLEAMRRARVNSAGAPVRPLTVLSTRVLPDAAAAAAASLRGPDRAALGLDADETFRRRLLAAGLPAALLGLLLWGTSRASRPAAGVGLLLALAGGFAA
jgi:cyclophilin family peptidyl-prolyl cis-trans isomerase